MVDIPGSVNGACTREQAIAVLGDRGLRLALRTHALIRPWHGVYIDGERALEPCSRAAAALLLCGPDAAISGPTAALLYGCEAANDTSTVHVTLPATRNVRRRQGLVPHFLDVESDGIVELAGVRLVPLHLAIAEMLCGDDRRLALACADQAVAILPVGRQPRFREDIAHRLATRLDPRGISRAKCLLRLATGLAESPRESQLHLLVVDAGFPLPMQQLEIYDLAGRYRYTLDFAWRELRIALEYDGFEAHENRQEHDAERDRYLARCGWITIRATSEDLHNPRRLLDELRAAFRRRR